MASTKFKYSPKSIAASDPTPAPATGKTKVSVTDKLNVWVTDHLTRIPFVLKMLFVHNLFIMVKAGLSIVDGLRILHAQVENKRLKKTIAGIKNEVEEGHSFSEALADYPSVFPSIYVSMIAAGETSGKMQESLEQVHIQMKKSHELTSRIQGAMIYPAVVITAMTGIGIEMVVFVLPKILVLFNDFGAELPLPTRILIALVKAIEQYGIFLAVGVIGLAILAVWLEKKPKIKRQVHALNLKMPIFGAVIQKINVARFTMTLSSLLQSAIPIIDAIKITSNVQSNVRFRESLVAVAEVLKKGVALSDALAEYPNYFPPMVVQMIMVGEQSGQVEQMLGELAAYYSDEVDATMRNFSTIIEPVLIVVMGLAVAGMAVAVIMPMYSLAQSF
ncbi:MAG: hypothetical protein A3I29_01330 [Candidatus Magasanikbacteria bacterium RIFCSPLOWO2_02_FULL_44_11]|uniref:Type II secretion system protein GspF domain-containing protein n=2 Tax=Candidatus Magasanikiibacteriota TaxID=1752731 RepID=A0A1F6N9S9_9BACT|nr:MAG: hypothetical protein A3D53_03070 [Candidatus Magasanikbacteria bacterium RIFCSPHIGHO2_02_FULL_45_10]OGH80656.1 MAG: hypothetical protein A3I29_01330 [Candidatus Magasanikbacteria bacterium RIFCSPLOWO2_02_FULL_44_11]